MQTKRAFYSHSRDKAVKLYAISHKINYREKRSSPWPLVLDNLQAIKMFKMGILISLEAPSLHKSRLTA